MRLIATEPELGILQSSGEAVDDHRIAMAVDGVLNLADHASQSFGRQPALEDRELHALTVLFADLRDTPEPGCAHGLRIRDVVGDEDVHAFT